MTAGTAGTAGSPAITWGGSGIFQSGFGLLNFSTAGVERLRLENNGDVIVGPGGSGTLTVNGPGTFTGNIGAVDGNFSGNISAANYPPTITGAAQALAYYNGSGDLDDIPGASVDNTSGGLLYTKTEQPNNVSGGFTLHSWNLSFDPLQASPDDTWNFHSIQAFYDVNSSGFAQGTNGQALNVVNLGITHQGTGDIGASTFVTMGGTIGNGTDPITIKGVSLIPGTPQLAANVTIDGQLLGFGSGVVINSAAASTSNFNVQVFYDNNNIQVPSNNYYSANFAPQILSIANNSNYNGLNISPQIPTLTGNANLNYIATGGTITTGSATGSIVGWNNNPVLVTQGTNSGMVGWAHNPLITTMGSSGSWTGASIGGTITTSHGNIQGISISPSVFGGDANFTALSITPSGGATLGNATGINLNLSSINSTNPQGCISISSDSRVQINATTQLLAAQGFQIGSRIEHAFSVPNGSPVTGTDELAVNIAGDFLVQDDVANGAFGIGFNSVGFIASMGVATGKTVDTVTTFLPAASLVDPGFATGGTVTDFHIIRTFPPLPSGGTLNITNLYGFKLDSAFGDFGAAATNAWGLYIDGATTENYFKNSIAIDTTSKKVSSSSVGLEVGPTKKALFSGDLQFGGGLFARTTTVTTTYTIDSGSTKDYVIFADTSGAGFTITLPTPTAGRTLVIKDSTGSFAANNLTVNPGSAKIDTVAGSEVYASNFMAITLVANGTDWFVI